MKIDDSPDYVETANLATEAFGTSSATFEPNHLKWAYERSFSEGTTVVKLTDEETGKKVGQISMVHQKIWIKNKPYKAVQLVDLFIVPEHRSLIATRMLFDEVGRQINKQGVRFALAMPNEAAVSVNERFFKMKTQLKLDIKVGITVPIKLRRLSIHREFEKSKREEFIALLDRFHTPARETGLRWSGDTLFQRLSGHKFRYSLHATENLLLIASPRVSRGIPYTLLAGFFCKDGTSVTKSDISAVTTAACAIWMRPLYIHAGLNACVPAPFGFTISDKYRPSPMLLQVRDFAIGGDALELQRFQLLDFDFG